MPPSILSRSHVVNDRQPAPTSWLWLCLSITLAFYTACNRSQPLEVEMVGVNYHWQLRYPGADNQLHTADDILTEKDLYLPAHTAVTVRVTSRDYIYVLKIPDLGQNQMGVPDVVFNMAFATGDPGQYAYVGDQMCGFSHDTLNGSLVILPPQAFDRWLDQQRQAGADH